MECTLVCKGFGHVDSIWRDRACLQSMALFDEISAVQQEFQFVYCLF